MTNINRETKNIKRRAFSLVEMLVSLGIISVIIIIFFNTILIAIQVTVRNSARSSVREELTNITTLISRDIRRADRLDTAECQDDSCTLTVSFETVVWGTCDTSICKTDENGTIIYRSDPDIIISTLLFEQAFVSGTTDIKNNIQVTVIGEHVNESLEISNIIRQISTSTRNYEL